MSTISDIAKEAGVSVATVSRVINGSTKVLPETAEKVKKAIEKFNYQPNVWGRRLRRKESRIILIFVPNIRNPYYASIVSGIEDSARRNNYGTILCITYSDITREREFIQLLSSGQADGAIVVATSKLSNDISKLAKTFPVVQCSEYCQDESVDHVSIDNFLAAKEVTQYLLSLNHRCIGFVGSTNLYISSELRKNGYIEALKEANIDIDNRFIGYADDEYSFHSGVRAVKKMLSGIDRPTAIFCISDVIALGAVRAAEDRGLFVPKDLSVIGFDDVEYASMFNPKLTTVSQPCYSLGKVSVDMLLKQIINGQTSSSQTDSGTFLEHKLILRGSTTALRV